MFKKMSFQASQIFNFSTVYREVRFFLIFSKHCLCVCYSIFPKLFDLSKKKPITLTNAVNVTGFFLL